MTRLLPIYLIGGGGGWTRDVSWRAWWSWRGSVRVDRGLWRLATVLEADPEALPSV